MRSIGTILGVAVVGYLVETVVTSVTIYRPYLARDLGKATRVSVDTFVEAFKEGYFGHLSPK